jgi:outer membrane protein TolC
MVLETINQNTFGANLSWSLFEGNGDRNRAASYHSQELSAQARREQISRSLFCDWAKAHDQLTALNRQRELAAQAASEADELAAIAYKSYRAGSLTYLELQNANYKVLEAKLQLARVQIQLLTTEAVLASLTSKEQP